MKFVKHSLVIILLSVFVFNSCKNDLKLNAPYKEMPSIYAILNPSESKQVIRINKVFLGEGDANQMAQVADSINYPAGELTVSLDHNNQFGAKDKPTIVFTEEMVTANPGSFAKAQRVYVTTEAITTQGTYFLTVKNNRTGNVFKAKTAAFEPIKDQGFLPFRPPYYPYVLIGPPNDNSADFLDYGSDVQHDGGSIRFLPNTAALYQLTMRFHFKDIGVSYADSIHFVDYNFTNKTLKNVDKLQGKDYIVYQFKRADMYNAIGIGLSRMNLNNNIPGRKMYKIQFLVYTTTQDYIDYQQFVSPSLSIAQNKPLYSNFDNQAALGIFTFRTTYSIEKEMATSFKSEFAYNSNTCAYQFLTNTGAKPGCN